MTGDDVTALVAETGFCHGRTYPLVFVILKKVRKWEGVAGEAGMGTLHSLDCFLLTGDISIFGGPKKAGILT